MRTEWLGPCRYDWTEDCFPLGGDSLALGAFATVGKNRRVCDLGCGAGALGLLLLAREPTLAYTGVEREAPAAERARNNLTQNALAGEIITADYTDRAALTGAGRFDLAVSNPPYFAAGSGASGGAARMEAGCGLDGLCASAAYLLKNGGRFALVYRPERLCALFAALTASGLEPKRLRLLQHAPDQKPSAVLVEAVRQGRPGLEVLPVFLTGNEE